jgi:hypothetical protein
MNNLMYIIKKLLNWIRIILLIIKIFNMEDIIHNFFNEIFFNNISEGEGEGEGEKKEKEKDDYNKEIHLNSLMLKTISAVALICWFKLSKDEMGYVILGIVLSEILEKVVEMTK